MRARRHVHRAPDLTSLLDVLFILVFASLIGTAAAREAEPPPSPPPAKPATPRPPAPPPEVAALRTQALANLGTELATRTPLVIRISEQGVVTALETGDQRITLDAPLLEGSPDPDVGLAYLGERSAELRLCRLAAVHMRAADLSRFLVIVAPAVPLADLPHALYRGLTRDLERCYAEQRGIATIVDPGFTP